MERNEERSEELGMIDHSCKPYPNICAIHVYYSLIQNGGNVPLPNNDSAMAYEGIPAGRYIIHGYENDYEVKYSADEGNPYLFIPLRNNNDGKFAFYRIDENGNIKEISHETE